LRPEYTVSDWAPAAAVLAPSSVSVSVAVSVAVLGDGRVVAAVLPDGDALDGDVLALDGDVLAGVLGVCTDGAPHAASITTASNAATARCVDRIIHPPYTCSMCCLVSLKRKDTQGVKYCQGVNVTFVALRKASVNDNDYQYFTLGENMIRSIWMQWWSYALLSAFFAALTAIFAKLGVEGVNSNLATAIRTVVILVIAWALVLVRGEMVGLVALSRRTFMFLVLSGAATGASWLCYFRALQLGNASLVAPVDKTSVVMVLILSAAVLGEPLTLQVIVGTLLIVGGTLVLIW